MAELEPLLQIIHVSDLHVSRGHGDKQKLNTANASRQRLWVREQLESHNLFDWHDGTLGHDDVGRLRFEEFLSTTFRQDKLWFPDNRTQPPIWLVDTGDASRFGGQQSLHEAQEMHRRWQAALGPNCLVRSLFGNHDTWPGTHPALLAGDDYRHQMGTQRETLRSHVPWRREQWSKPLSTLPSKQLPRIECYRLNTVSFGRLDSILAVGRVDEGELAELLNAIDGRGKTPTFRILLTHHPLAYPYLRSERKALIKDVMVLSNAGQVVDRLKNEGASNGPYPYVHLVLSGHTHKGQPGTALPENVKNIRQGPLGEDQLQLVSGPLMLLKSRVKATRKTASSPDFSDPSVFQSEQQFQLLRFYAYAGEPHGLWLQRYVFARTPGGDRFASIAELTSETYFYVG